MLPKSKFEAFGAALRELCLRHGVAVAPTEEGYVGVWDLGTDDEPVAGLQDCTAPVPEVPRTIPLPYFFETAIEARQHPGYIGHELGERLARGVQKLHPGSEIVPIGSHRVRGWAVVRPIQKK